MTKTYYTTNAEEAQKLIDRGYDVVLLNPKKKTPKHSGHQKRTYKAADFGLNDNIGVRTGSRSKGLIDLDGDCPEARRALGRYVPTGMICGRKSAPGSHRFVRVTDASISRLTYIDPFFTKDDTKKTDDHESIVLEIRGDGHHTLVPPSTHLNGERLTWARFGEPTSYTAADLIRRVGFAATAAVLGKYWNNWKGQRHDLTLALSGGMASAGVPEDETVKLIETVCAIAEDDELPDRVQAVHASYDKTGTGDPLTGWTRAGEIMGDMPAMRVIRNWLGCAPPDDRVLIFVHTGNLNKQGDQTIAALKEANDPPTLFIGNSRALARIDRDAEDRAFIKPLDDHALRFEAGKIAKFVKPGKLSKYDPDPEPVEVHMPLDLCRNILARGDVDLPVLRQILRAPCFADRTVTSLRIENGYNSVARAYLDLPADFKIHRLISPNPSAAEIAEALSLWRDDVLIDFPFSEQADLANALALALLPYGRLLIPGPTPLHMIEKPAPGTGGSLLVETITSVAAGPGGAATTTEKANEDEWRKAITTAVARGSQYFTIGNLSQTLDSAALSEALTTRQWEDRKLGTNSTIQGPIRFIWSATGNNPVVSHEIARRCVRIRLDAKIDRPAQRSGFKHTLPAWAIEHRAKLVWAALTLWSAWIRDGCPAGETLLGGFEDWSQTMGGLLATAGVPGFLGNIEEFYDGADLELSKWRALISVWWDQFGSDTVTAADLFFHAQQIDGFQFRSDKERGMRVEFGAMLRAKKDNHITVDATSFRIEDRGTHRKGQATYSLIHRDGITKRRKHESSNGKSEYTGDPGVIDLNTFREGVR